MSRTRLLNLLALTFGLGVMALLCSRIGWARLGADLGRVGWGFLWVCAVGGAMTVAESLSLWVSLGRRPRLRRVAAAAVAGGAVNTFTPLGEAGEAVKWNLLKGDGDGAEVASGVLAWNLFYRISKYAYAFIAPVALVLAHPGLFSTRTLVLVEVATLVACIPSLVLFALVWRGSAEIAVRLAQKVPFLRSRDPKKLLEKARRVDDLVRVFARSRRRDAVVATGLLLLARVLAGIEVYVALRALGSPVDPITALFLYGGMLVIGVYLAIAPTQFGVAEAGQYLLFALVGLSPALGLAQALVRRVRELITNLLGFAYLGLRSLRADPPATRTRGDAS